MSNITGTRGFPQLLILAAIIVVIAALYLAQELLIPVALAVLFCFMLAPLAKRLERVGLGRIPSVIIVVLFSFSIFGFVGWTVARQLVSVTAKLPEYKDNIHHKVQSLRGKTDTHLSQLSNAIKEIRQELATQPATQTAVVMPANSQEMQRSEDHGDAWMKSAPLEPPQTLRSAEPISVRLVEPSATLWGIVVGMFGIVAQPLATAGMVVILVIFILLQREDLRDRFLSLMGQGRVHVTTVAIDEAAQRISRYLLAQLVVNCLYGIPIAIGLHLLGLPNAPLWGLLGIMLRYLPYIGPGITAVMPIALSLAVFDDWWHPMAVVGLFVAIELIVNNAVEPWLYGSTAGLSTMAVIVAAIFWTWLWGPVGLLLSTPMTTCLVVLGRHIPQLEFLSTLLSDEHVLDPPTRFYQRLLAMDQEEAADLMEEFLESGTTILVAYDQLLLPALQLAEKDHHRGVIDENRLRFVYQSIRSMIEETGDRLSEAAEHSSASDAPASLPPGFLVLTIPARDEADELTASMLTQVLRLRGYDAKHLSAEYSSGELLKEVEEFAPRVVCISALPPEAVSHGRYLFKKLRAQRPELPIIIGLWNTRAEIEKVATRIGLNGAGKVVTSLAQAVEQVYLIAQNETLPPESASTPQAEEVPV